MEEIWLLAMPLVCLQPDLWKPAQAKLVLQAVSALGYKGKELPRATCRAKSPGWTRAVQNLLSFMFLSASAFLFYFFLLKVLPCFLPSGPFSASREIWEILGETENHAHLSYLRVFVWRNLTNSSCFHAPSRQISGCFRNSWYKSLMDTQ